MATAYRTLGTLAVVLAVGIAWAPPPASAQDDVRSTLFREADRALQAAREAQADILAPEAYGEAMELYRQAEQDLQRGRDLSDIRRRLQRAVELFREATDATELAKVTFSQTLAAREDAVNAEASSFAPRVWRDAEDRFGRAARELEGGDVNDARQEASRAERLYRDAELAAIKANYLNETWELLDRAEDQDVDERAPTTFRHARELVSLAEQRLNENRYDTDEPRALAQEAKREARHAMYLAQRIREYRDSDQRLEDLLLSVEEPIRRIAGAAEVTVSFEEGLQPPTEAITRKINALQDSLRAVLSTLEGREEMVTTLEARVGELESQLGGVQEERSALAERMEAQARLEQRFATVNRMFSRAEGQVLRDGDNVIIRMYGLSFPVGSATIEPRNFPLLTKVQQAIRTFANATVTIEGHTDSFGSDGANMRLSQERADAVRQYLLANMDFDPGRIDAVGHGETRPVASNETQEGRARNRRIDVVIHPRIGS